MNRMKRRTLLASSIGLLTTAASAPAAWQVSSRSAPAPLEAGATLHELSLTTATDSVELVLAAFSSQKCSLRLLDYEREADNPGLATALRKISAVAGTNGGFFSPQFTPLGLCIADGQRHGTLARSSLLGGLWELRQGRLRILWRDEFQDQPGITQLLQTGPRLVSAGKPISGLDTKASRPRSFLLWDGKSQWALGTARYCSLAQLAELLCTPELLPGVKVARALNLDGGRSIGIWAQRTDGTEHYDSPMVTVRNYVAVVAK